MTWIIYVAAYLVGFGIGWTLCMAAGRGPLRHPYITPEETQE